MQLPGPVRAVVGLLANAADEAKNLPDRAIELPMLAVSTALQMSLRAQQRYARLAARGDQVINRRPVPDDPPPWATFDEPVSAVELRAATLRDPDPALRARAASQLLDELLADRTQTTADSAPATAGGAEKVAAAKSGPRKSSAAKSSTAKSSTAKSTAAKSSAAPKSGAAKSTAKSTAKASTAKSGAGPRGSGKTINKPRHTTPSRFDTVDDE